MTSAWSMVVMTGLMAEGLMRPAACQSTTDASPRAPVGVNWLVIAMMTRSRRAVL